MQRKGCKLMKWFDVYPRCKKLINGFTLRTVDLAWATIFVYKTAQKKNFGVLIDAKVNKSDKGDLLSAVKKHVTDYKWKQLLLSIAVFRPLIETGCLLKVGHIYF